MIEADPYSSMTVNKNKVYATFKFFALLFFYKITLSEKPSFLNTGNFIWLRAL